MVALAASVSPQARFYYLGISAIIRRHLSSSASQSSSGTYHRSDFTNHGFTGIYEPGGPTEGPLRDAYTPPRITPSTLKAHLDAFVVGQERAKRTLATAVYNHYQRVQELQRRDEEEEEMLAQEERRRMAAHPRHPVEGRQDDGGGRRDVLRVPSLTQGWSEDEFPGQQQTTTVGGWSNPVSTEERPSSTSSSRRPQQQQQTTNFTLPGQTPASPPPLFDPTPLSLEKSNILLLGPSGVGKTLMAKTLARVLEVPFSMSDCTPFTQAGYIGEDAEVCVQRLLAAANYDVARAERGIICLDEIDKIATAKVSHGKDVSGEGVQQALLKIIEGTTLQVQAKAERGSAPPGRSGAHQHGYSPPGTTSSGSGQQPSTPGGQKGETFNVKTDNILFICAGAFNGLHKMILDRVSKGGIGFGATIRSPPGSSGTDLHETVIEGEDELFEKHLPYYTPPKETASHHSNLNEKPKRTYNTLDLVEPQDLQKYGLIPELVGRIPISCALSSLSVDALVKVLTEPRNSLLKQYEQLFQLSSIELRLTSAALHQIATTASKMGTGARGLRTVMERLLADAMYETPGSGIKYVLITEDVSLLKQGPVYFPRGQQGRFHSMIAAEEEAWEERRRGKEEGFMERRARVNSEGGAARTFEEYREKQVSAAGS